MCIFSSEIIFNVPHPHWWKMYYFTNLSAFKLKAFLMLYPKCFFIKISKWNHATCCILIQNIVWPNCNLPRSKMYPLIDMWMIILNPTNDVLSKAPWGLIAPFNALLLHGQIDQCFRKMMIPFSVYSKCFKNRHHIIRCILMYNFVFSL